MSTPEGISPAVVANEGLTVRLAKLWALRIPNRLEKRVPVLADSFRDGAWTTAWPPVAAFAPIVGLVVGFLAALVWPGLEFAYTESLVFMILVIAGAILSGPVGLMLLAGYAIGNLFFAEGYFNSSSYSNAVFRMVTNWGGKLIGLALLAFPAFLLPPLARRLAWSGFKAGSLREQPGMMAALYSVVCGALVFLWAQAMAVLVRPVFVWPSSGSAPTAEAVHNVQALWPWLVAAAMVAAVGRMLFERRALSRSPRVTAVAEAYRQWLLQGQRRPSAWRRLPSPVRLLMVTLLGTALLAGTYEHWLDPVIAFAGIGILEAWRLGLFGSMAGLGNAIRRVPLLVRFIAAVLIAYWVAYVPISALFQASSLRPVLLGALAGMAVFYILLRPPQGRSATT